MATVDDVIAQMRAEGLAELPNGVPVLDGKLHKFGKGKKSWYCLKETILKSGRVIVSGSFGRFRGQDDGKVTVSMDWEGVSPEERAAAEAKRAELERVEREKAQRAVEMAANRARQQWSDAAQTGESPYAVRKQITTPGARFDGSTLLIPAVVFEGDKARLVGLQKIAPDGEKRFNKNMAKQGSCLPIGAHGEPAAPIKFVAEGYATARSISMAIDASLPGYVAWDAGNLMHVARMARRRHPDDHLLICADDDYQLEQRLTEWLLEDYAVAAAVPIDGAEHVVANADGAEVRIILRWGRDAQGVAYIEADARSDRRFDQRKFENAGIKAACAAAADVGNASVVIPQFSARGENKWTDFNDLHCVEGLEAVTAQLAAAITSALAPAAPTEGDAAQEQQLAAAAQALVGATAGPEDDLYDKALAVVLGHERASISLVQRHLRIGYNRAARLLEMMELRGAVSPLQVNGNRDVLLKPTAAPAPAAAMQAPAAAAPAAAGGGGSEPPPWEGEGAGEPADDERPWTYDLARSEKGNLLPTLSNVVLILQNVEEWKGVIAYDEFSGQVVKLKPPPFPGGERGEWSDMDDLRCTLWMQRAFGFAPKGDVVMGAVLLIADMNKYHVVRHYLNGLRWDGVPRLARWLIDRLGAEDNAYNQTVARKWLIAAVARIYKPGCKADNVLILEGEQGIYKSTALAVLGGEWFTDAPFRMGDKDAYVVIRGKWIIELAELDSFNKADSTGAKLFFGQYIDRYRTFYGKRATDVPRQQLFAGTTNSDAYLKDDTGNRRYWPVKVIFVDLEGLKADRDQIWAEAVHEFNAGAKWWPTSDEKEMFSTEQDARYVGDAYISVIGNWLVGRSQASMAEILGDALKLDVAKWTRPEQQRVGRCMSEMGWTRKRSTKVIAGKRDWVYHRPESQKGEGEDEPL